MGLLLTGTVNVGRSAKFKAIHTFEAKARRIQVTYEASHVKAGLRHMPMSLNVLSVERKCIRKV